MEWEITWDGDPEDLCVTTWGTVTLDGLDGYMRAAFADPRYRPGLRILIDPQPRRVASGHG